MKLNQREERLDRIAWIDAALDLLVRRSIDDVRVEPLARDLGVTKGSFYWHFKDRGALLSAVLDRWQHRATFDVIARIEKSNEPPAKRIKRLIGLPYSSNRAGRAALIELAIRGWARRDPVAAAAVSEVDRRRLQYIQSLYSKLGFSEAAAQTRSYLAYSYNLGEALIHTDESEAEKNKRRRDCESYLLQLETKTKG